MKFLLFLLLICSHAFSTEAFISFKDAKEKWGLQKFESEKFKTLGATPLARAPMAVDLLQSQSLKKKKLDEIRQLLGNPDGYLFSEAILAYKIQTQKDAPNESWQLVFIPDENLKVVKEIKIHKRCCDKAN